MNTKYLKWTWLLFILMPSFVIGQKSLVFSVKTVNDWGAPLPNCYIQFILPEQNKDVSFITDTNGIKIIVLKIQSEAIVHGTTEKYQVSKMEFTGLDKRKDFDTILVNLVFKPILSFSHGFTQINLDSCICFCNIEELEDTIRLYRYFEKSTDFDWFIKLIEREPDKYEIVNHTANGVQRGNVRPYPPIVIKFLKHDMLELQFRDNVKIYRVRGVENIHGFYYELIKN